MFATDVSTNEMGDLVKMQLTEGGSWSVNTFNVIGSNAHKVTYTMPKTKTYVMEPDMTYVNQARSLIQKVVNGETLSEQDLEVKK